jgi:hypothetical protein
MTVYNTILKIDYLFLTIRNKFLALEASSVYHIVNNLYARLSLDYNTDLLSSYAEINFTGTISLLYYIVFNN